MKIEPIGAEEAFLPVCYRVNGEKRQRVFILREHTMAELERYVSLQLQPTDQVIDLVAGLMDDPQAATWEPMRAVVEASTSLFVWLLSQPEDGADAPDAAWVDAYVTAPMRMQILRIQDRLNRMEDLEKNAQALREAAAGRRAARQIVAGRSSSTG